MRDILNKMERQRIIGRAEDWNYIRELRNSVSHNYPMMAMNTINALIKEVETLRNVEERLKKMDKVKNILI